MFWHKTFIADKMLLLDFLHFVVAAKTVDLQPALCTLVRFIKVNNILKLDGAS